MKGFLIMEYNAFNFDWGLFESRSTTSSSTISPDIWESDGSHQSRKDFGYRLSQIAGVLDEGESLPISENDVYRAACSLSKYCLNNSDVFSMLSCINLLNAAIKTPQWKEKLSYGDIKLRAADLFAQCISDPKTFNQVQCYYDVAGHCAYMKIYGVIFSFHNLRLDDSIMSFCSSSRNKKISWNGLRLQKIASKVMEIADEESSLAQIPDYKLTLMKSKMEAGLAKLYFSKRLGSSSRTNASSTSSRNYFSARM